MPINIGPRAKPAKDPNAGTQQSRVAKGDPGSRMFAGALKRLSDPKSVKATVSTSNVARQGLSKVDRIAGSGRLPRKRRTA